MGCWRKSSKEITLTSDTSHNFEAVANFSSQNYLLVEKLANIFKEQYANLYKYYSQVQLPYRLFGPWAACAVNLEIEKTGISYHRDNYDCSNGLCWVVPFGNYSGAYLLFPELSVSINATPGDVICFKSKLLLHGTTDFVGTRKSLVFFSSNNIFFPCKEQ